MKFSLYIPIALAVAAVAFCIMPVGPDPVFYPVPKDGVGALPTGLGRLGVPGIPMIMVCDVCKQPATQSTSRLEPGTRITKGIRYSCDQHASLPMLERWSGKIALSFLVLMAFAIVGLVIRRRQRSRQNLASELKA